MAAMIHGRAHASSAVHGSAVGRPVCGMAPVQRARRPQQHGLGEGAAVVVGSQMLPEQVVHLSSISARGS